MTEAYIYDAVRTPRGKGRKDGSLHEVTAVRLSAGVLNAIKERNGLEGHAVEDVIWGNATQVGDPPAAWVDQPAPDLGRHYVAVDANALYVYLDVDLTPHLIGAFDDYEFEVTAPGYSARVRYERYLEVEPDGPFARAASSRIGAELIACFARI